MLAFLTCGVVVVLKWSAAACVGTWTYLFSVGTGTDSRRRASRVFGRQKAESLLPTLLEMEASDAKVAMDASEELRERRGVAGSYWVQGMSPFWFALRTMMWCCSFFASSGMGSVWDDTGYVERGMVKDQEV